VSELILHDSIVVILDEIRGWYMKTMYVLLVLLSIFPFFSNEKKPVIVLSQEQKIKHELESVVFLQKAGMLRPQDHSFYFRTDDEWTGFSTIFLGYRYGVNEYFNIAFEGGAGLPQVYLANLLLHFKIFESKNRYFFLGTRIRMGYKYQDADPVMFVKNDNNDMGYMGLGKDYLTIEDRHSFYFATDLTAAVRFGKYRDHSFYYTIYPKVDFNLQKPEVWVLFAPIMFGYEARFGRYMEWTFAVEAGYSFPLPWGSIPDGKWINFPSLANVSLNYRFGDTFYYNTIIEK